MPDDAHDGPPDDIEIIEVTLVEKEAAQLRLEVDRLDGIETPAWIRAVAEAEPPA